MRLALLALALFAILTGAACSGGGGSPAAANEIRFALTDFKFTPVTVEIPAGTVVKFTAKNGGSVEHDITIDKINFKLLVPTAREVSKNIGPLEAGTYEIHCSVAGHTEAGMKATLVVK